jgi:topoisomerase-4 subunit A
VNLADLIDVKGMKAQGNQMTKLKVKEIVLTHPIDESPEPWPELKVNTEVGEDADTEILEEDDDEGPTPSMEWDLTKKEEEDNEDQIKLF